MEKESSGNHLAPKISVPAARQSVIMRIQQLGGPVQIFTDMQANISLHSVCPFLVRWCE